MSKRDKIYQEFSENGYPTDPEEKKEFAARLLGARLVGALDSVLEDKLKVLKGTETENNNPNYKAIRTLNDDQKEAVEALLKDSCRIYFYRMLLKMRNFPDYLEVNVMELDEETDTLKKICDVGDEIELHHRYFDWIEEFSDNIDEA